ncbi:hypothetical protein HaLaN_07025 [Haematococcus lacustris]|uniref:Uncharacterized protein n=1 Tax=Haematococcus lacustris TaxID=44745 RepID=A0A699YWX4_HAELA|nr:hypothetical protein HaLaN_07025 [Haematococcus lacustris]
MLNHTLACIIHSVYDYVLNKQQHETHDLIRPPPPHPRFCDRDVSAALNSRSCAVGPGPRPTELCRRDGPPSHDKAKQTRPGVGALA